MGVTDSLQKAHTMSRGLLIWVDRSLLGGNDWGMHRGGDKSFAGLSWLCFEPARRASNWSRETAHLIFYWSVFQEVLRQDVRTVEWILFSVHKRVRLWHWKVRWGGWVFTELVTTDHIFSLLYNIDRPRFQEGALHGHNRVSSRQNMRTHMAGEIWIWTILSPPIIQLAQLTESIYIRCLAYWFSWVQSWLLLLHVFFGGEELITILGIVLVRGASAQRFVSAQYLWVLVLNWDSSFYLTLLLTVVETDLRALHYLR